MKIVAMVPVRHEAWVLPHSLAALSGFCDAMLVSDRGSTNGALEIDRQFPRVVVRNAPRTRRRVWSPPSGG